ncbi:sensor histidine kinase [Pseudomarimonas salicorniae]|uniref:histidine kinase n=1 Tax=Pseudomarimonas salicorniae TaxID=2933270 RepID=A0ABT0GF47_9GAMM|nr:two-component regulator propeller domain-containing protein [Lysobacter sp. CAU 1642]MCK7593156.1 ATP-binding protein [Lysobacter sp. CAU 1642]
MSAAPQSERYAMTAPGAASGEWGRPRGPRWPGFLLLALLWLPALAMAETFVDPAAARFQRLDAERGLSQSSVLALAQDSERRIWIGTLNGLNQFDGYRNRVFSPRGEGSGEIADNYITSLLPDEEGRMWVGTLEGISRWEPQDQSFVTFRVDPSRPEGLRSNLTLALHRDREGRLWAGTEAGLARWNPEADRFEHWPPGGDPAAGLPDARITSITSGSGSVLWVGTNAGPARYDVDTARLVPLDGFPHPGAPVTSIVLDRQGRLFVGLDKRGVVMGDVEGGGWRELPVASGSRSLGSPLVRSVYVDRQDRLWVGSEDGLDGLRIEEGEIVESVRYRSSRLSSTGLGGGVVAAILEDADGTLWVGSWNQGITWLSPENNRFASFTAETAATVGFRNPSSIALAADGDDLWIGTGSGLYGFDTGQRRLWEVSPGQDQQIYYCALAVDGRLWFGRATGLRILDPATGAFEDRVLPGSLAQGRLRRMLLVGDRVWTAVDPFGLAVLDREFREVYSQHPIARVITFIERFDERMVLLGAYDGLYWFDAESGALLHRHALGPASAPGPSPRLPLAPMAFARGADGRAWIATNGSGLAELRMEEGDPASARFRMLDSRDGLSDGALKSIEVAPDGVLWLSSASGLTAFDPRSDEFSNFNRGDGTLGRDYINAASARFADGRLAFGGMDGFTLFDPSRISGSHAELPPVPLISDLEADGRELSVGRGLGNSGPGESVMLPRGGVRSLQIQFASPEYVDAARTHYRYRLDPLETEWTEVGADRRLASYTGLRPGSYRFLVMASGNRNEWSEPRSLHLQVPPFWWQTLWARIALVGLAIVALWFLHRLRLASVARRNDWLTVQVAARTRELDSRTRALEEAKNHAEQALQQLEETQQELVRSEKMAALGQLVAGVAHEVNTPLGVALTASSVLRDASGRLGGQVEAGQLRRADFDRFLGTVSESTAMIERNLERAAQLIANFKQVSVDRTSDGRREFDLAAYLEEVLESLRLMWKQRDISMEVDCPPGIVLDSFPGAIGQVITNITQNAVVHAFGRDGRGRMQIRCRARDDRSVEIRLSDDGVGMPEAVRSRVFDPFFTTRRNEGGTGLGLHIVYNLVTQKLGGQIRVESQPGQGTEITLRLPPTAPG